MISPPALTVFTRRTQPRRTERNHQHHCIEQQKSIDHPGIHVSLLIILVRQRRDRCRPTETPSPPRGERGDGFGTKSPAYGSKARSMGVFSPVMNRSRRAHPQRKIAAGESRDKPGPASKRRHEAQSKAVLSSWLMPSTQTFSKVSPCSAEARFAEDRQPEAGVHSGLMGKKS